MGEHSNKEVMVNVIKLDNELSRPSVASQTDNDGNIVAMGVQMLKTLDANRYATKKTIAQGMLDIALLTANASQLKYILQVGQKHEFYTLMLSLIVISIILQLAVAILFVAIGGLNINKESDHIAAIVLNDALQGVLCVFLGSSLNINKENDQDKANKTNNICLALNIVIVTLNVIISAFDLKDNYGNVPKED